MDNVKRRTNNRRKVLCIDVSRPDVDDLDLILQPHQPGKRINLTGFQADMLGTFFPDRQGNQLTDCNERVRAAVRSAVICYIGNAARGELLAICNLTLDRGATMMAEHTKRLEHLAGRILSRLGVRHSADAGCSMSPSFAL